MRNPPELDGVADLSSLLYLDMPNVVHNLKCRYDKNEIYTGISSILIALNPYQSLPCYGNEEMEKYSSKAKHAKAEPHVYNVAEDAYRTLIKSGDNQSMVVCGESGAGKSESAKHLMRHLAYTTSKDVLGRNFHEGGSRGSVSERKELEKKVLRILAANPILEAFGNAKTVLNNNSSRFGKFTKLLFADAKGSARIVGSAIETFLLEKSRVIFQTKGERNYHIFYQLMSGADAKLKSRLKIEGGPRSFFYTGQSGCDKVPGIPDKDRFDEFLSSLTLAGFSDDDVDGILRVVAAILHLSNIKFTIDNKEVCHIDQKTVGSLNTAAELLGVTPEALTKALCFRTIKVGMQVISKPYNKETSVINRDSMAKALFSKMFDWVVQTINKVMYVGNSSNLKWIGILDVFGFECFAYNSFEQLCINLANERLQQFFNVHVIKSEQEEYEREAIYWEAVNVPDNQACLDLILGKPQGLLAILDSACNTPKATDLTYTQQIFKQYRKHQSIKQVRVLPGTKGRAKVRINGFEIVHYAKNVCYDAKEFLKKNVDQVTDDTKTLFSDTSLETTFKIMNTEFRRGDTKSPSSKGAKKKRGKAKKKQLSVGGGFAKQLRLLMKSLESTRPFFIRCVKPNLAKKPNMWVDYLVTNQLEAGGLIQALKIIKDGYPTRVGYKTIWGKYSKVLKNPPADLNERDFVEALIIAFKFSRSQFVLGLTKAFFKSDQQDFVTSLLNPTTDLSPEVVNGIKRHLVRKKIVRSMAVVKALARWKFMEQQRKTRSAVFAIQAFARSIQAKARVLHAREQAAKEFKTALNAVYALPETEKKIISVVATQAARWLSKVSSLQFAEGLEFFTEVATATKLCQAIVMLGCPIDPHAEAAPASSAARDNCNGFIHSCKQLGVKRKFLCGVEDMLMLKRPQHALDTILNLAIATKKSLDAFPTVNYEVNENPDFKKNRNGGIVFLARGGILTMMSEDRREELFNPGHIMRKKAKLEAERKARQAAERKRKKEEAEKKKKLAKEKALAEAEEKRKALEKAKQEKEAAKEAAAKKQMASKAKKDATIAAAAAAAAAIPVVVASAGIAATSSATTTSQPEQTGTTAEVKKPKKLPPPAPKKTETASATRSNSKLGEVTEKDDVLSSHGASEKLEEELQQEEQQLEKQLEKIEEKNQKRRTVVESPTISTSVGESSTRSPTKSVIEKPLPDPTSASEVQQSAQELQDFIKKSKPFVSMLVTLLRKYSHTGMLEEVGLTWRDFPPMTLFERAEKLEIAPQKWSEWIWDFVNDRIHTERNKQMFPHWIQCIKHAQGHLDLSYGSITTSVVKELCTTLIGEFRPRILSQLSNSNSMDRKGMMLALAPIKGKQKSGFFSSSKEPTTAEHMMSLNLSCNYMNHDGMPMLSDLITQVITIQEVWLCGNPIGDKGVEALCFGLNQASVLSEEQGGIGQPLLNRLFLQSCSITKRGYNTMVDFLKSYPYPLVVFVSGNYFKGVPMALASKGAAAYEKHALTIPALEGKLQKECLDVVMKYYDRILKHPKTNKWRQISLNRACRYSDKKDQEEAQSWWAANLVANGFVKYEKSRKGDEYILGQQDKDDWSGIVWSSKFARQYQEVVLGIEQEAAMFNLFLDLLMRVGTPYTGTIEKEHIYMELKTNERVRHALKLNTVDFGKFQERFSSVDKIRSGLMKVRAFVEYAAAFRTTLKNFQEIFGKYQNEKGEVEKMALFKAMQKDQQVRKFFGFKKFHYKQFGDLFKTITFNRRSMSFNNMVDFQSGKIKRRRSTAMGQNVQLITEEMEGQVPPLQDNKRVALRVLLPDDSYMTMSAFSEWTIAKLRPLIEGKMETRKTPIPKSYKIAIEGAIIEDSKINLWTLAFQHLNSFPKMITLKMIAINFTAGVYRMTMRANLRKGISLDTARVIALERQDIVHVSEIELDKKSMAIRGYVKPPAELYVGQRIQYSPAGAELLLSASIQSVSPLTILVFDSKSVASEFRGKTIEQVELSTIRKLSGWISMKSSKGQKCAELVSA